MWEEGFILIFRATEYYEEYFKLNKRPLSHIKYLVAANLKKECFSVQIENVSIFLKIDFLMIIEDFFFKFELGLI